jgi:hypothetical protein
MFNKKQVTEIQVQSTYVPNQDIKVFFQKFDRQTQLKFNVYAVTEINPSIEQFWHGFIGIQPYTADLDNKEKNFMWQLKNHKMIDHITTSVYLKESIGNSSSIKFGSMDEEGI